MSSSVIFFFFSSRRRHTRCSRDWSSDVCSSDLPGGSDSGWFNVTVDGTGPDIRLLAPTGDVAVEFPTIQIAWCDNTSLSSSTRWIKVNGVLKTSNFDYVANSGPSDCTIKATSTSTTVSLVGGSNQVEARICDNFNNCTIRYFTITRISPPIVTPKGDK